MQQDWFIHDSHSSHFRSPFGAVSCGTAVVLTLAVAENIKPDKVQLLCWQPQDKRKVIDMTFRSNKKGYSVYRTTVKAPATPGWLWYYFVIEKGGQTWYYGNHTKLGGMGAVSYEPPSPWQITVFEQGAATPAWFKDTIMYQIFVDRFYNGNPGGAVYHAPKGSMIHSHWDNDPVYVRDMKDGSILSYDFFGGNLAGVIEKLPYLKEMGVGVIYFNPLFKAASNHKYDTADYKQIDPIFGDNELFSRLCAKAEEMGIAVILDGVFSHTGSDSIYFNREGNYPAVGAYQSKASPYYGWYRFHNWPDYYESWWGIDTLPNVEELNPDYQSYIIESKDSVIRQWAQLGAKGWRLDVADELPDQFIQKLHTTLKDVDRESILIGEVWEDASHKEAYGILRPYFQGAELDGVMNYPFRQLVLDFLQSRKTSGQTNQALMSLKENYPEHNLYASMNLLGSHDVPRILTLLGDEQYGADLSPRQLAAKRLDEQQRKQGIAKLKIAALWQMTFPGVPCIYYGDEAGVEGYTDPLNRRTYPWGREDKELLAWYKHLTALRNSHPVLRTGDWLPVDTEDDVLAYMRFITHGYDVFCQERENNFALVIINRSDREITVSLEVSGWVSSHILYDMTNKEAEVAVGNGIVTMTLAPYEAKVLLQKVPTDDKSCGVLLHPTSLPSEYGIGDFGKSAYDFLDFLSDGKQKLWQILPLNPPGIGDSPYMALSASAGNPLLIAPEILMQEGLVSPKTVAAEKLKLQEATTNIDQVPFQAVKEFKEHLFREAYQNFFKQHKAEEYTLFCDENKGWLKDYALFMALSDHYDGKPWHKWSKDLIARKEKALVFWHNKLTNEIRYHSFLQYLFHRQWAAVKAYAQQKGIKIIGDLPIFVAHNSSDVWANQHAFQLDESGNPTVVAGVPPDYFSETGQLWGNPLYRWEAMAANDYQWWRDRFAHLLKQVDMVRVDHFRGFESYWEIPAGEETAVKGKWKKGPGAAFFQTLERYLGSVPIIAEDLGIITDEVVDLKNTLSYPGMKVLHFCFGYAVQGECPPLGIDRDCVVYTGTHDNNTTIGWYEEDLPKMSGFKECVDTYLGGKKQVNNEELSWGLITLAYQSKARTVIIPMQDLLGLGSTARMNTPGTLADTNWSWRMSSGFDSAVAKRLSKLVQTYQR